MANILKRKYIADEILRIIDEAERELVIISPYIKLTPEIKTAFKNKFDKLAISLVFFHGKIDQYTFQFFDEFPNIMIYSNEYLHTKCYLNEKRALVTSMNLYAYSMQNNFELGVVFKNKGLDKENYKRILEETLFIKERSHFITEYKIKFQENKGKTVHCVVCRKNIFPKSVRKQLDGPMQWDKDCVCETCLDELTLLERKGESENIFLNMVNTVIVAGTKLKYQ